MAEPGATEIGIDFRGVVQNAINPFAEVRSGPGQPGFNNVAPQAMPTDPTSDWRWGVVTLTADGGSRFSPLQSAPSGSLTVPVEAGDVDHYLVVSATPSAHYPLIWDQKYHTMYRYPYKIQLRGAWAEGFEPGHDRATRFGWGSGSVHPNGGGFVGVGATVDPTVYIGPNAAVIGGTVTGNARIEDYAVVRSTATVADNAVVGGLTQVTFYATFNGNSETRMVHSDRNTMFPGNLPFLSVGGTTKLYGEVSLNGLDGQPLTQGAFSNFVADWMLQPGQGHGWERTTVPVEVTLPTPPGWPG
jgi:hypothetical protein